MRYLRLALGMALLAMLAIALLSLAMKGDGPQASEPTARAKSPEIGVRGVPPAVPVAVRAQPPAVAAALSRPVVPPPPAVVPNAPMPPEPSPARQATSVPMPVSVAVEAAPQLPAALPDELPPWPKNAPAVADSPHEDPGRTVEIEQGDREFAGFGELGLPDLMPTEPAIPMAPLVPAIDTTSVPPNSVVPSTEPGALPVPAKPAADKPKAKPKPPVAKAAKPPTPPLVAPAPAEPKPAAPLPAVPLPSATLAESQPWSAESCETIPATPSRPLAVEAGGWVQQGITFNAQRPGDRFNGPVATNDRDSDYQLNQFWFYLSRPTCTGGEGWDLGGRIDAFYGTDWRFYKSLGLEDQINRDDRFYGLSLPQFYLEVAWNDLTVRLGHYETRFGVESLPAVENFFYSHSYAMTYAQPLLATGLDAEYKLTDCWSLRAGFNRGWSMFEDNNEALTFLGGVRWTSDDCRTHVAFTLSTGAEDPFIAPGEVNPGQPGGQNNRFAYNLAVSQQLGQRWRYVLEHNLGYEDNAALGPQLNRQDAQWYGLNQYLFYTLNQHWSLGARFEWLRDDDGARVRGASLFVPDRIWHGGPGFAGDFYELSLGANWRPSANVLLRPEVRWDWYDGNTDLSGRLPFDDGAHSNQFLAALDLVWTY